MQPTQFSEIPNPSIFRKIAAAQWLPAKDPTVYGYLDVDATPALAHLEAVRARTGVKVTMTHLVARAIATAFARHPDFNAKIDFLGRIKRRHSVDLFIQVSTQNGEDLSGVRVDDADRKPLVALAREVSEKAAAIRENRDPVFERSRRLFGLLPAWLVKPVLGAVDFAVNELELHLPGQGMPRDAFGTAMVTNVGMFGIDTGFAPLVPIARCVVVVLVAEVRQRPWVVSDRVEPRPVLRLCASFDHRVLDGFQAGVLAREVEGLLSDPAQLGDEPAEPAPGAAKKVAGEPREPKVKSPV